MAALTAQVATAAKPTVRIIRLISIMAFNLSALLKIYTLHAFSVKHTPYKPSRAEWDIMIHFWAVLLAFLRGLAFAKCQEE
jgi:hypothetical protein